MSTDQTEIPVGQEVGSVGETAVAKADAVGGGEVMDLIRTALTDESVSIEKLERLMDLKERYDAKVAKAEYLAALSEFQARCPEIPKTKAVKFDDHAGAKTAYHYAPLEVMTRIIDPILRECDLSYSWTTEGIENGSLNVVCVLRHGGGHEERVPFPVPIATNAKMSAAQKAGSAETYGMRRSLISILGLTTAESDNDGRMPGEQGDTATVTKKQADELNRIADEVGADKAAFCTYLVVPSLAEIPASQFEFARQRLEAKRGGGS